MFSNVIRPFIWFVLISTFSGVLARNFSLTVYNYTPTNFTATAPDMIPKRVFHDGNPVKLAVPYIQFPTYAVLFIGDNGNNAFAYDQGDIYGPQCSDQMTYYHCVFSDTKDGLTLKILWP